jgi:biopolymer transport protein ExbB
MSSIAEALVATAIGLAVAIPAVAAFNWFQRRIRATVSNTDALSRVLLAHLEGEVHGRGGANAAREDAPRSSRTSAAPTVRSGQLRSVQAPI